MVEYLSTYAKFFSLPIQLNTSVQKLSKAGNSFTIKTNVGEFHAKNIVVATGPFQTPFIPKFSSNLSSTVYQVHSSEYKNQNQLKEGSVLVVGGGNSGAQIAVELSKERKVYLSIGQKMMFLPQTIGTKNLFWWFDKLGLLNVNINTNVGLFLSKRHDPIFGLELKNLIKNATVELKSRTQSIHNDLFYFEDHTQLHVDNVIWSTGFKEEYSWIQIDDLIDSNGDPIHQRGVTTIEGLYFLGLPWQFRRGSGLLYGVGKDANYLYQQICN